MRRVTTCTACDAEWDSAAARFCGRCGERLPAPERRPPRAFSTRGTAWFGRHRTGVIVGLLVVTVGAIGASSATVGELIPPGGASSSDVALPDRDEAESFGELGNLTPEQREALEFSDPGRLRCEPQGCEAWRMELDQDNTSIAANHGWVAVIDGTTLRVRSTSIGVAGGATEHLPARTERSSTSSVVGSGSGSGQALGEEPSAEAPAWPGRDHDLSALFDDVGDGSPAGPPERMELAEDGTVILQWPHLLVAVADDLRWGVTPPTGPFWYLEVQGDRVIALSDDSRQARSTDGRSRPSGPVRVTGFDLDDGAAVWDTSSTAPRNFVDGGLIVTTSDGALERIATDDGTSVWRRSLNPDERVQITTGPWLVVGNQRTSTLLDVLTGEEIATRDTSALVTPMQRMGDLWVALWVDGSAPGRPPPPVVLVALDEQGEEQWRTSLTPLAGGACCPAAVPWLDGTIAVFDSAADPPVWRTVDAATGQQRDADELPQPLLPLAAATSRSYVSSDAPGRVIQEGQRGVGLLSLDGSATVTGPNDIEVVSLDPLVVAQGKQVLGVRPIPAD